MTLLLYCARRATVFQTWLQGYLVRVSDKESLSPRADLQVHHQGVAGVQQSGLLCTEQQLESTRKMENTNISRLQIPWRPGMRLPDPHLTSCVSSKPNHSLQLQYGIRFQTLRTTGWDLSNPTQHWMPIGRWLVATHWPEPEASLV